MDSSGSQSPFDFRNQIAFVQDVVKWFQIGTEHVLVSVITFSLDVIEEFPLNKYTKKETLIKAIGSVTYHGLLTNTSGALRYVRLNSFLSKNGGRPQVDKLLIVLTDGVSDNPTETIKEAELLRKMDNIKVYAVGIGKRTSHSELLSITGTEDRIQKAPNFHFLSDNLYSLERKICKIDGGWSHWTEWSPCSKTCGFGNQFRTRNCDTPKPEKGGKFCDGSPVKKKTCSLKKCFVCGDYPIDIFFFLDASLSVFHWNFGKERAFVHTFVNKTRIGKNALRVGVAVYSSSVYEEFNLNTHYHKSRMLADIDQIKYNWGLTHTWKALDYVRSKAFLAKNGGRPNARQVLIFLADGNSSDESKTKKSADLMKKNKNIQVYVIGIGSRIDRQELNRIASRRENVIYIENFDRLKYMEEKIRHTVCPENPHQ